MIGLHLLAQGWDTTRKNRAAALLGNLSNAFAHLRPYKRVVAVVMDNDRYALELKQWLPEIIVDARKTPQGRPNADNDIHKSMTSEEFARWRSADIPPVSGVLVAVNNEMGTTDTLHTWNIDVAHRLADLGIGAVFGNWAITHPSPEKLRTETGQAFLRVMSDYRDLHRVGIHIGGNTRLDSVPPWFTHDPQLWIDAARDAQTAPPLMIASEFTGDYLNGVGPYGIAGYLDYFGVSEVAAGRDVIAYLSQHVATVPYLLGTAWFCGGVGSNHKAWDRYNALHRDSFWNTIISEAHMVQIKENPVQNNGPAGIVRLHIPFSGLNFRKGHGLNYPILSVLREGEVLQLTGNRVPLEADGRYEWREAVLLCHDNLSGWLAMVDGVWFAPLKP